MFRLSSVLCAGIVCLSTLPAIAQPETAAKPGDTFDNAAIKARKKPVLKPAATESPTTKSPAKPADAPTPKSSDLPGKPAAGTPAKAPRKPAFTPIPVELADGFVEVWDDYFAKKLPAPQAVAKFVLELQTAKKHAHIVAFLEAALLNGQSQPWMYEALAVSMEAIRRPPADIERVLLSSVDFRTFDVPSLLYSATYLANFGRDTRALQLCRQASKIDPTRPEPYALGLNLAVKLKDADGIAWGAAGTLSRVWTKNYVSHHEHAEKMAIDLEATLRKAGKTAEADRIILALTEARQRDLVVELTWSGGADLELIVEEPGGSICQVSRSRTSGGGVFVHDGYGPDPKNTYERYLCPRGMSGDYRVIVRHLWGVVVGKKAELKITRYQGTAQESTETLFVEVGSQDKRFKVPLNRGRLKEPLPPPVLDDLLADKPKQRPNLMQLAREAPRGGEATRRMTRQGAQLARAAAPVGFQPVISVISEGVSMTSQAVVSADRRYVRLTLAPVFSSITDVQTFSFFQGGGGQQQQPAVAP